MSDRRCRYCQQLFQPSRFHPHQIVCGRPDCQRHRQREYHRPKIEADPVYRQVCRDSQQKWRAHHPDYPRQYRRAHPGSLQPNKQAQRGRDRQRHLQNLLRNSFWAFLILQLTQRAFPLPERVCSRVVGLGA